ncbi:MAG: molybdate ABC transporter substrate-binding protein [Terriglobales bacterium]
MHRILLIITLLFSLAASAEDLAIAAAADLNFALKDIAQQYRRDTGNTLKLSFGSSGNFFVQIQNGAPFDIFFSADVAYPQKLEQAGLAEPGTLYRYAIGKIVLWVPNSSKLDLAKGINVLLDPAIKKIAIANPTHAPYGRAAEEALKKSGVYDSIKDKLVLGENISQTAQFVHTGNADIGIIAESLAVSPTMTSEGRFVAVNTNLYSPIQQAAVVLKTSGKKANAKDFLDYLKRPAIQQIMKNYGFAGT